MIIHVLQMIRSIKALLGIVVFLLLGFLFINPTAAAAFTLSGNVSNSVGAVISGTTIDVRDVITNNDIGSAVTDVSGNYTITNITGGNYNIQLTPPVASPYTPVIAPNYSITTDRVLNFVLVQGSVTLSGHVYGASGVPVANQTIALTNTTSGSTIAQTITDSNGNYSLQASPSTYGISISGGSLDSSLGIPEDYRLTVPTYSLTQSNILDITIPAKRIDVHTQDSNGVSVSNVAINAGNSINPLSFINQGSLSIGGGVLAAGLSRYGYGMPTPNTDVNGNTTLWLFPGDHGHVYQFIATAPAGSNVSTTSTTVNVVGDMPLTIIMPQIVTLSGHIYGANGTPVPGQTIALTDANSGSTIAQSTTDSSGSYSLKAAPNTYGMSISGGSLDSSLGIPEFYRLTVPSYTLNQSATVDLTIPAKQIIIHTTSSGGVPVSGVGINAGNSINPSSFINQGSLSIGGGITNAGGVSSYGFGMPTPSTDVNGNTTIWLFPGDHGHVYQIIASPPSGSTFSTVSTTLNVVGDTTFAIVLPQVITLTGHIYGATGVPVSNQSIALIDTTSGSPIAQTTTDNVGSYTLHASPNTYGISISGGSLDSSLGIPESYRISAPSYILSQNSVLDITIPAKRIDINTQDNVGNPISGIAINAGNSINPSSFINQGSLSIGGGITNAGGVSSYGFGMPTPSTNLMGKATIWLFPGDHGHVYQFIASPPSGSPFSSFITTVNVSSDLTEIFALQFIHSTPFTQAFLSPSPYPDGTYPNPVTVTLSATAASGYTIANTYYTVDGGTQQTYTSSFTVSGGGSHTITYWSIDNAGVYEAPNTKTFTIHANIAPQIGSLTDTTINEGDTYSTTGSFTDADSTSWTGTVDYGDGSGVQNLTLNPDNTFSLTHTYQDNGIYTVAVQITDNQGASSSIHPSITVNNLAPQVGLIDAPDVALVNTPVSLSVNFVDAGVLDSHTAIIDWGDGVTSSGSITETNGSGSVTGSHTYTTGGTYNIVVTVTDNAGASGQSPAHQMLINVSPTAHANGPYSVAEGSDVQLNGTATDDQTNLTYSRDLDNNGSYETLGQSVSFHGVDGPATQTVGLQVCDPYGACGTDTAQITITNVAPKVDPVTVSNSTLPINTSLTASTTFTDPGVLDTHTASIDWGDGITGPGSVTETNGSGSVSGTHTYTATGVYKILIAVTDKDGGQGINYYQYVAIYDPSAGFVTGSGSIISPQGAEPQFPTLTGDATFGISAKYTSGQTIPTGQVMFSFPNGGFDFSSTSYDYLVVSGNTAYLSGQGTINGVGSYTFLVSVVDGQPDTLRVRIADNTTNTIIYDNQPGAADNILATEAISHGQIKVH